MNINSLFFIKSSPLQSSGVDELVAVVGDVDEGGALVEGHPTDVVVNGGEGHCGGEGMDGEAAGQVVGLL